MCDSGDCFGCRYTSHAGGHASSAPVKKEPAEIPAPAPEISSSSTLPAPNPEHLREWLEAALDEVADVMRERGAKYGPGNIAEFGDLGVLVRLSDKLARLRNTREDFADESNRDAWMDVIGYGLIGLAWADGNWPGSEENKK